MTVTGTLIATLDHDGIDESVFVLPGQVDLAGIVHYGPYSYAAHIIDGDEDTAWEVIAELHHMKIKKERRS